MQKSRPDRRVQRTRKLIQEALVSLMLEKGYEKITIQEIIDRANVGRSTFYAHYRDKEDLLLRGVAEIAYGDEVETRVAGDIEQLTHEGVFDTISTIDMFTHVQKNDRLHKVMFKRNKENAIFEKGTAFLYANMTAQLKRLTEDGQETTIPISLLAHYLTGGLMSLIKWWLDNDMPYSPLEMDGLFRKMAMPGVWEVIEKNKRNKQNS